MPKLSKDALDAIITQWHAAQGESITKDQDLLEISTDKATFDVPAPCDGTLKETLRKEGEKVKVGEIIAIIEGERIKHGRSK